MSTSYPSASGENPSVTELVSGIVGDIQDLGVQHLALFRNEIKQDLRKGGEAVSVLVVGLAVAQVGGIVICLAVVQLIAHLLPDLPIWICYGVVGAIVVGIGTVAIMNGIKKLQKLEEFTDTVKQALKEDEQWLTKPN